MSESLEKRLFVLEKRLTGELFLRSKLRKDMLNKTQCFIDTPPFYSPNSVSATQPEVYGRLGDKDARAHV